MKVTLVTCFNAAWQYGRVPSPYVPLNLLCLAAGLRDHGHEVTILDQTLALFDGRLTSGPDFHEQVCELIAANRPDVVGLTTMCNSYPQTLSLARHWRARAPETKIVLGGPQATVADVGTLEAFPWIDVIVRGEADLSLPALLDRWEQRAAADDLDGITWRDADGRVRRNPDARLLLDMDELPIPAYDLYPLDQNHVSMVPIEAGRGCPYGCTFCSTNIFFNRRYRIKSPERLIEEMKLLHAAGGWATFDLVHDMFTVDRRWVSRFCRAMVDAGQPFKWGCSARVDRVDAALLAEMKQAGCVGMFFGIETGSQRLQPIIKKNLKMETVLPIMQACLDNDLSPTASCITGYPDETVADAMDSFHLALDVLSLSSKARAQMHTLAPLIGSPLYVSHRDELLFDGHSSDISLFLLTDEEVEVVRRHPGIFPNFYYIPTPHVDRDLLKAISAATYTCYGLFIVMRRAGVDLKSVLEGWVTWKRQHVPDESMSQHYYYSHFGVDLCRYLNEKVLPPLASSVPYLRDMVRYFEVKYSLQRWHDPQPTLFAQFEYEVQQLTTAVRNPNWAAPTEPKPTDLLFVNLSPAEERGFAYLEVRIPRQEAALIRPGDRVEVRDPVKQLRTREHLIIRNQTQQRVFATRHHMTPRGLRALGLVPAA